MGSDVLGLWLAESVAELPGGRRPMAEFYASFVAWMVARHGGCGWSRRAFSNAMRDRGYASFRGTGGVRTLGGYGLRQDVI